MPPERYDTLRDEADEARSDGPDDRERELFARWDALLEAAMSEPYPKAKQLARGERRYRRKVASPKQWQAIIAAKQGPCRVCSTPTSNGFDIGKVEFHHVVARVHGGEDKADNIVPIHRFCHGMVTARSPGHCKQLLGSLSDAEYAYMIERGGEDYPERAYGVTYTRGDAP